MNIKKILSILVCVALLMCFAGCSKEEPAKATAPAVSSVPETAGVLLLSIGTEFKIVYDTDGLVIAVDGMNTTANEILLSYSDFIGIACDTVASDLVKRSIDAGKHPLTNVVVIKQTPDSKSPSAAFMENIRIDVASASGYDVVVVLVDNLDANGYITAETAKDIIARQCQLTGTTATCSDVKDGFYTLTFELAGAEQEYKVNAVTGTVVLESLPSDLDISDADQYNDPLDMGEPDLTPDDHYGDPAFDDYMDAPQEGDEN